MSLLTRCPACTTLYKVVPDQLRISQGWVKCGLCGEIFDASQHLLEAATESEELPEQADSDPAPELPDQEALQAVDDAIPESRSAALPQADFQVPETIADAPETVDAAPDLPAPAAVSEPSPESAVFSPLADAEGQAVGVDLTPLPVPADVSAPGLALADSEGDTDTISPDSGQDGPTEAAAAEPLAGLLVASATAADDAGRDVPLSFMRDARPAGRWQGAWGRRLLGLLAGLFSVLLLAQWLYQEHDRLAASQPAWTPALQKICLALRCSLAPLQQIESLAIDAADFSKIGADRYHLSFTLKNSARLALALPSIELTLTDAQERAVIRRVLSPKEMAAPSSDLPAGSEWPVSATLRIQADAGLPSVVGYRLLAFYP